MHIDIAGATKLFASMMQNLATKLNIKIDKAKSKENEIWRHN
jgi:hypothetical protein